MEEILLGRQRQLGTDPPCTALSIFSLQNQMILVANKVGELNREALRK